MIRMLLTVGLVLGLVADPIRACTCKMADIKSGLASSAHVFRAQVDGALRSEVDGVAWLEIHVSRIDVLTGGKIPFEVVKSLFDGSACGLSVRVPDVYWFFTDEKGITSSCSSSRSASDPGAEELNSRIVKQVRDRFRKDAEKERRRGEKVDSAN